MNPPIEEIARATRLLVSGLHRWHRPIDLWRIWRVWTGSDGGAPIAKHPRTWTLDERRAAVRGERASTLRRN